MVILWSPTDTAQCRACSSVTVALKARDQNFPSSNPLATCSNDAAHNNCINHAACTSSEYIQLTNIQEIRNLHRLLWKPYSGSAFGYSVVVCCFLGRAFTSPSYDCALPSCQCLDYPMELLSLCSLISTLIYIHNIDYWYFQHNRQLLPRETIESIVQS